MERLDNGEERVENPVDNPLDIVSLVLVFNGQKGLIGRIDESNNGTKGGGPYSKEDQDDEQGGTRKHKVLFGDLGLVLWVV